MVIRLHRTFSPRTSKCLVLLRHVNFLCLWEGSISILVLQGVKPKGGGEAVYPRSRRRSAVHPRVLIFKAMKIDSQALQTGKKPERPAAKSVSRYSYHLILHLPHRQPVSDKGTFASAAHVEGMDFFPHPCLAKWASQFYLVSYFCSWFWIQSVGGKTDITILKHEKVREACSSS